MEINFSSMGLVELWNTFRTEISEEECPEEYFLIFNGFDIKFEIVRAIEEDGIIKKDAGTRVAIKTPNKGYVSISRWDFEREINRRRQVMKEILEEKFKREPLAKARVLENIRGESNEK